MTNLLETLNQLPSKSIIAISGFGGSGKTTLANKLSKEIKAQIVHVDDFAVYNSENTKEFSFWNMMDFKRLENEVFIPYKNQTKEILYGKFDWDKNIIIEYCKLNSERTIIVEGVGLLRPELLKYFDFSIWVDCDIEEAIFRGMKRAKENEINNDKLWNGLWKQNDLECFEKYQPKNNVSYKYDNRNRKS